MSKELGLVSKRTQKVSSELLMNKNQLRGSMKDKVQGLKSKRQRKESKAQELKNKRQLGQGSWSKKQ